MLSLKGNAIFSGRSRSRLNPLLVACPDDGGTHSRLPDGRTAIGFHVEIWRVRRVEDRPMKITRPRKLFVIVSLGLLVATSLAAAEAVKTRDAVDKSVTL